MTEFKRDYVPDIAALAALLLFGVASAFPDVRAYFKDFPLGLGALIGTIIGAYIGFRSLTTATQYTAFQQRELQKAQWEQDRLQQERHWEGERSREDARRKEKRNALASALLAELNDWIVSLGTTADLLQDGIDIGDQEALNKAAREYGDGMSAIGTPLFEASVGDLGLLGGESAYRTIDAYAGIKICMLSLKTTPPTPLTIENLRFSIAKIEAAVEALARTTTHPSQAASLPES